ncbi:TLP18.3/Psb32/MOLO-1 phosphatase superfamily protein [Luteibacter rhizovicinus]|uniref:TLP18.3/Psb32/MOLO-1 phosphatase superfamily protein n=1 Tax=Luteibacter rhizovicinus TaxID=242606 RepID=A0A4R3YTD4_9GAMM|nr:TPM domain-containing protein [Luteibacter rhizovicinus]TCV94978.1 TLP18.3/Psb32/MOLO-1 phosphatase superfamily protein [Luteibacter rhizovicinus]
MDMKRVFANLFGAWFQLHRQFPSDVLDAIAHDVGEGESTHRGELRVVIESRLPIGSVMAGYTAHVHALDLFTHLRVWDTHDNCGVLLYVLLAEHHIEIVADRGIVARVGQGEWETITTEMRKAFAAGQWREGMVAGVAAANALLALHFPADGSPRTNELPDRPLIL